MERADVNGTQGLKPKEFVAAYNFAAKDKHLTAFFKQPKAFVTVMKKQGMIP